MTDPRTGLPIVAELGRSETPEETWARKDDARRARRQHQTAINLVLSLVASLAIVIALVAVVARPDRSLNTAVDYRQVASQAHIAGVVVAAPKLPSTYSSNRADYQDSTSDGVKVWTVGLITPDKQYIGIHQGVDANTTWVSNQLQQGTVSGHRTIDGTRWAVYDRRADGSSAGNLEYSLVATFGRSTIVLAGTADDASFRTVATAITEQQQQ
jgi:hypothetical protein